MEHLKTGAREVLEFGVLELFELLVYRGLIQFIPRVL